jgi:hypothetical protein
LASGSDSARWQQQQQRHQLILDHGHWANYTRQQQQLREHEASTAAHWGLQASGQSHQTDGKHYAAQISHHHFAHSSHHSLPPSLMPSHRHTHYHRPYAMPASPTNCQLQAAKVPVVEANPEADNSSPASADRYEAARSQKDRLEHTGDNLYHSYPFHLFVHLKKTMSREKFMK